LGLLVRQQRAQELDLRQTGDARAAPAFDRGGDAIEQHHAGHDRASREMPRKRPVRGRYRKCFAEFGGAHRTPPRTGLPAGRRALIRPAIAATRGQARARTRTTSGWAPAAATADAARTRPGPAPPRTAAATRRRTAAGPAAPARSAAR